MAPDVKRELFSLKESLRHLSKNGHAVALKTGTEIEDMSAQEIKVLREVSWGVLPLTVKIGGAEARQDIRSMLSLGVDCLLAPMIESVYALSCFVETALAIQDEYQRKVNLAFNLETIVAVQSLDNLIETNAFSQIAQVTIGRDDLSKSMHLSIDDEEVIRVAQESVKKIKSKEKLTSLGGGLSAQNIKQIAYAVDSDYLNTRHLIFANSNTVKARAERVLLDLLAWEKRLYGLLSKRFPERANYYEKRIDTLAKRSRNWEVLRAAKS